LIARIEYSHQTIRSGSSHQTNTEFGSAKQTSPARIIRVLAENLYATRDKQASRALHGCRPQALEGALCFIKQLELARQTGGA
jgi:hypothetical protein